MPLSIMLLMAALAPLVAGTASICVRVSDQMSGSGTPDPRPTQGKSVCWGDVAMPCNTHGDTMLAGKPPLLCRGICGGQRNFLPQHPNCSSIAQHCPTATPKYSLEIQKLTRWTMDDRECVGKEDTRTLPTIPCSYPALK